MEESIRLIREEQKLQLSNQVICIKQLQRLLEENAALRRTKHKDSLSVKRRLDVIRREKASTGEVLVTALVSFVLSLAILSKTSASSRAKQQNGDIVRRIRPQQSEEQPWAQGEQARSFLSRMFWASDRVVDADTALAAERQFHQDWINRKDEQWREFLINHSELINKIGTEVLQKLADPALLEEMKNKERTFGEQQHRKDNLASRETEDDDYLKMLSSSGK